MKRADAFETICLVNSSGFHLGLCDHVVAKSFESNLEIEYVSLGVILINLYLITSGIGVEVLGMSHAGSHAMVLIISRD